MGGLQRELRTRNIIKVGQKIKIPSGTSGTPGGPGTEQTGGAHLRHLHGRQGRQPLEKSQRSSSEKALAGPKSRASTVSKSNTIYAGQVLKLPAK
jgi:LysM repeat protein